MNISIPLGCLRCSQIGLSRGINHKSISFISTSSSCLARDLYDLLGVNKNASAEQIKAAYFEKSKKFHPDMNPSKPELHKAFVEINEAYNILGNRSKRRVYDQKCRYSVPPQTAYNPGSYGSPFEYEVKPPPGFRHTVDFENFTDYCRTYHEDGDVNREARHPQVVLGLVMFILFGAVIHYFFISERQKKFNRYLDEKDRKLMDTYNKVREDAKKNGFQRQLEILVERQKATTASLEVKDD